MAFISGIGFNNNLFNVAAAPIATVTSSPVRIVSNPVTVTPPVIGAPIISAPVATLPTTVVDAVSPIQVAGLAQAMNRTATFAHQLGVPAYFKLRAVEEVPQAVVSEPVQIVAPVEVAAPAPVAVPVAAAIPQKEASVARPAPQKEASVAQPAPVAVPAPAPVVAVQPTLPPAPILEVASANPAQVNVGPNIQVTLDKDTNTLTFNANGVAIPINLNGIQTIQNPAPVQVTQLGEAEAAAQLPPLPVGWKWGFQSITLPDAQPAASQTQYVVKYLTPGQTAAPATQYVAAPPTQYVAAPPTASYAAGPAYTTTYAAPAYAAPAYAPAYAAAPPVYSYAGAPVTYAYI